MSRQDWKEKRNVCSLFFLNSGTFFLRSHRTRLAFAYMRMMRNSSTTHIRRCITIIYTNVNWVFSSFILHVSISNIFCFRRWTNDIFCFPSSYIYTCINRCNNIVSSNTCGMLKDKQRNFIIKMKAKQSF